MPIQVVNNPDRPQRPEENILGALMQSVQLFQRNMEFQQQLSLEKEKFAAQVKEQADLLDLRQKTLKQQEEYQKNEQRLAQQRLDLTSQELGLHRDTLGETIRHNKAEEDVNKLKAQKTSAGVLTGSEVRQRAILHWEDFQRDPANQLDASVGAGKYGAGFSERELDLRARAINSTLQSGANNPALGAIANTPMGAQFMKERNDLRSELNQVENARQARQKQKRFYIENVVTDPAEKDALSGYYREDRPVDPMTTDADEAAIKAGMPVLRGINPAATLPGSPFQAAASAAQKAKERAYALQETLVAGEPDANKRTTALNAIADMIASGRRTGDPSAYANAQDYLNALVDKLKPTWGEEKARQFAIDCATAAKGAEKKPSTSAFNPK